MTDRSIKKIKKIEELLISVGIDIAKKGEGALFVVSDNCKYKKMLKQRFEPFSIFEPGAKKILLSLAIIDGAVIINKEGMVVDYGAKIESKRVFREYGTRHAAAYSASLEKDSLSVLISQEEKKIKIFRQGKITVQIDALEKNVEKKVREANEILESVGVGTLSTIGVSALAPGLGIAVVPGIILLGVPYYFFKKYIKNKFK
ncbi:MAG: DNA integrity scanning protein DisA nucleotide-binding domain protein [Candidatus Pacearchaeota archaeon]